MNNTSAKLRGKGMIALWLVLLALSLAGATFAWFTFQTSTDVTPMTGKVTGGTGDLGISTSPDGPFGETCELLLIGRIATGRYDGTGPIAIPATVRNGQYGGIDSASAAQKTYTAAFPGSSVKRTVYAGADGKPGTADDWYAYDVNGDGKPETVFIGEDRTPGTAADWYAYDVNGDGKLEKIFVGADGIPGTADDWYHYDVDGDGLLESICIGADRTPGSADDWYSADPDRDGAYENVYIGSDGRPGTADDWYTSDSGARTNIPSVPGAGGGFPVRTNGTSAEGGNGFGNGETGESVPRNGRYGGVDSASAGQTTYTQTANGSDLTVHVGTDGKPGTADDWYESDVNGDGKAEKVFVGTDGTAGSADDWYRYDVNNDGQMEKIMIGADRKGGTADDWYHYDVDGDGRLESVYAGADKTPGTADDWYSGDPDKDGAYEEVHIGSDGIAGTADDWYNNDSGTRTTIPSLPSAGTSFPIRSNGTNAGGGNGLGNAEAEAGNLPQNGRYGGVDSGAASSQDSYEGTFNGPPTEREVYVGADGVQGTSDDWYPYDVDGDGRNERVFLGTDRRGGTADDWYQYDVDNDGTMEKVFVGTDKTPGTADDWYHYNVNGDSVLESIYIGSDGTPGTADDWYAGDPDNDGTYENVYIGPDAKPGTSDDWYVNDSGARTNVPEGDFPVRSNGAASDGGDGLGNGESTTPTSSLGGSGALVSGGIDPVSTVDLVNFYAATAQNRDGISILYRSVADVDAVTFHGKLYLKSANAGCDVYFWQEQLSFGSDPQILAAARLGLRCTTSSGTTTHIFRLDAMGSTAGAESRRTAMAANSVVASVNEAGAATLVSDPSVPISECFLGGRPLMSIGADEVAEVEFWLYLEGCDDNCFNPVQDKDVELQLAFASE